MYLRQPNKWNDFLLAEAIENVGLPSRVVTFMRRKAQATVHSDAHAKQLADRQGIELQQIDEKHLTWLGQLLKKFDFKLYDVTDARNLSHFVKQAIRQTTIANSAAADNAGLTDEEREADADRVYVAIEPIIDWAMGIKSDSPEDLQTLADMKALRKRITRALKRAGLPEGEIATAQGIFDRSVMSHFENSDDLQLRLRRIMMVLTLDPPYYEEELKKADDLRKAYGLAQVFLDNPKKEEDKVIHEFDNGYYWYDVQSHACDFEGKEMGHCGRGEQGTLVSLRAGGGRKMKPFVTLEFDGTTLYQIKGKGNVAPKKDLWPYVDWFIENMGVERITETGQHATDYEGFDEMLEYFHEKHPDIKLRSAWVKDATELLEQYESSTEQDTETDLELDWPGGPDNVQEVGIVLRHRVFWPVKDIVAEEDTHRLTWEIKQDAQSIAEETLYPNPRVDAANIFRKGEQDSRTAMLRIELIWSDSFEPPDPDDEEIIKNELERLDGYLAQISEISDWLVSTQAAPEEAEFDYNGFWERVQQRLEQYGVYRDIAGEVDARDELAAAGQLPLPFHGEPQSGPEHDWRPGMPVTEERILQRWQQIIK